MFSRAHLLIQKQLNDLENDPKILVSRLNEDNIFELIALIEGQKNTLFENGLFQIYMKFTENYNSEPPQVYFQTIPYHPNIDMLTGRPSIDFLDNKSKWRPDYTIHDILKYLQQLLSNPLLDLAVNMEAVFMLKGNPVQYENITRQSVLATQKIRDILNQNVGTTTSSQEKSNIKIDIDLSKYFNHDLSTHTNADINNKTESVSLQKFPLFNIKQEKVNLIRDKSNKKLALNQDKLFKHVSYDEYCSLWKGIATSKASQTDDNAYLKNNLLENPNLLSQHLSISIKELEEQVYQQLKDHKNIIYGKFDFSDRSIDKFLIGNNKKLNQTNEEQTTKATTTGVTTAKKAKTDDLFEKEVDDLINWTKNIV